MQTMLKKDVGKNEKPWAENRHVLHLARRSNRCTVLGPAGYEAMTTFRPTDHDHPWEALEPSNIRDAGLRSERQVAGGPDAMNAVVKMVASRFPCPPPVVGECKTAPEWLRDVMYGDEAAFESFDMSEYGEPSIRTRLIGPPPSYLSYEDQECHWSPSHD